MTRLSFSCAESRQGVATQGLVGAEKLPSPQSGAWSVVSPSVASVGGLPHRGVGALDGPRRLHLHGVRGFGVGSCGDRRRAEASWASCALLLLFAVLNWPRPRWDCCRLMVLDRCAVSRSACATCDLTAICKGVLHMCHDSAYVYKALRAAGGSLARKNIKYCENEGWKMVHHFRCKLTTCKCQKLRARTYLQ